jgi:hypothetical protein
MESPLIDQVFSKNVRELHLDLEDTIITPVVDGWHNTGLINVEKIKHIKELFRPDSLHLFSFALWNERELTLFTKFVQPMIEAELGMVIASKPTVDDQILPACCREMGLAVDLVDFSEMSAFWSKQGAFRLYMRQRHRVTHMHGTKITAVLLDDAVKTESFGLMDLEVNAAVLNIDLPNSVLLGHLQTFLRRIS